MSSENYKEYNYLHNLAIHLALMVGSYGVSSPKSQHKESQFLSFKEPLEYG